MLTYSLNLGNFNSLEFSANIKGLIPKVVEVVEVLNVVMFSSYNSRSRSVYIGQLGTFKDDNG